jgi:hypothetical protein
MLNGGRNKSTAAVYGKDVLDLIEWMGDNKN